MSELWLEPSRTPGTGGGALAAPFPARGGLASKLTKVEGRGSAAFWAVSFSSASMLDVLSPDPGIVAMPCSHCVTPPPIEGKGPMAERVGSAGGRADGPGPARRAAGGGAAPPASRCPEEPSSRTEAFSSIRFPAENSRSMLRLVATEYASRKGSGRPRQTKTSAAVTW